MMVMMIDDKMMVMVVVMMMMIILKKTFIVAVFYRHSAYDTFDLFVVASTNIFRWKIIMIQILIN